jgi:hypothetical protein
MILDTLSGRLPIDADLVTPSPRGRSAGKGEVPY